MNVIMSDNRSRFGCVPLRKRSKRLKKKTYPEYIFEGRLSSVHPGNAVTSSLDLRNDAMENRTTIEDRKKKSSNVDILKDICVFFL